MAASLLRSSLLAEAGFRHAFSTRGPGRDGLDMDFALRRDPPRMRRHLAELAGEIGVSESAIHQATQVHGTVVVRANGDPAGLEALEADALVADPGHGWAVGVRVADCVPVLVADPRRGRVAAIHAGWKGVEAGVVRAAVSILRDAEPGATSRDFLAAIGPCIGSCCFEVGSDVADRIARASTEASVVRRVDAKAYVDLRRAVRHQLVALGLDDARIEDVPSAGGAGCTRCHEARFHSFRRDGDASGRMIAVIAANEPVPA